MKVLSWLPQGIQQNVHEPSKATEIFEAARSLSRALHNAIRKSYLEGRPPTWMDRWRIRRLERMLRLAYGHDLDEEP